MAQNKTVAVIDVGSNSIKLLVAKKGATAGSIENVFSETIETRISAGISHALPSLSDDAIEAGCTTIVELVRMAQKFNPQATRIVATSAVRDAINGMLLTEKVHDATGFSVQVLSGTEEATLIGKGLACDPQIAGIHSFTQMDLGGGSLELIHFHHGHIEQAISLQLGAVRLTERFITDRDSAISSETEALIQQHVTDALNNSGFKFEQPAAPLIATGGAFSISRAVLAAKLGKTLEEHSPVLQKSEITQLKNELMALPMHERIAVPHLPATRADIVPTALITIETVMDITGNDSVTHSFFNLRYGIAAELLEQ